MKWNIIPASFSFAIDAPYWQTWWFRFFSILITGLLIWMGFYLRINNVKKKTTLLRKMDMLKLEALRSQMNPHFLFNSMNAIQHYINSNEKRQANDYLTKFAKLMRTILDNSQKTSITISEDLEALKLYLDLEHLRFENQFSYEIEVDPEIDTDYIRIPHNLIHPYVENAIIHGLLNKPDKGKVHISLNMEGDFITCKVQDNGIGRKKAEALRKQQKGDYHQPAGMKLTKDRIATINEMQHSNLSVEITDLYDAQGKATGTSVHIHIPITNED